MLTKKKINDPMVIPVCLIAPFLTWFIVGWSMSSLGFDWGFLNLALNGLLTVIGLIIISKK
jgi:hypothetical protein